MASTTQIKNVTVVGAGGRLGRLITTALLDAGFTVVALARAESTTTALPDGVAAVRRVDFTSLEDLTGALEGQDAVVSVIGTMAVGQQRVLVEAAARAGVGRFVPSEYGLDTRAPGLRTTKLGRMLGPKIELSLEAGLLGIDIPNRKATIVDSGDEPFSASNREQVARAVVAVLQRPAETANRYLMVQSLTTTQNKLLKVVGEEMGQEFQAVERVTAADTEKAADDALAGGTRLTPSGPMSASTSLRMGRGARSGTKRRRMSSWGYGPRICGRVFGRY
ncbi:hypothetical protein PG993_011786 [Apiospora rasikravindrae]|uniref:NmrA-like domain-containing protein n=1 Tax=Apiospora rasikravindrae TaxID=990691 RepID=A0ABR1S223_9PEZI